MLARRTLLAAGGAAALPLPALAQAAPLRELRIGYQENGLLYIDKRQIQALYAIEAAISGQLPEPRRQARQARSKPLLDAPHAWMLAQRRRLSGKSTLGKALQCALSRWEALTRHLEDGRLSIDNNLAERQLRGIAVTRKNYLSVGSDAGGQGAAVIHTIAETAKPNGLDPEACIAAVLGRMARGHPISRLDELLPWKIRLNGTA